MVEVKKFDVIVTNMPFAQTITRKITENGKAKTENNISPLYYNGIAKNNGDSTCVLHCLRALKEGGRMALVVPEGFLFRKDIANMCVNSYYQKQNYKVLFLCLKIPS